VPILREAADGAPVTLECACGEKLPTPLAGYGDGCTVSCRCGVTYTATVDIGAMWRRQRELVAEVSRLTGIADAIALAATGKART
jgi:hypothetical protein